MNVRNLFNLFMSLVVMTVVGCGGGGGGGGGVSADPNAPATLTLSAAPSSTVINTPVTITANVLKSNGTAVATGTAVVFTTTGGSLSAVTTTNASGNATATLNSAANGTFTVTATVTGLPAKTAQVTFIDPNAPFAVAVTGAASANINTSVTLTATVTPAGTNGAGGPGGAIPDGTVVTFATSAGTVTTSAITTGGVATATLNGISAPTTASITATCGGIVSPAKTVTFIDPNAPASVAVTGNPASGFINNQGPITVTANVQQIAGGAVPAGTTVNFAITAGTGTLSSASATTNGAGNASVTLNSTIEGNVSVSATATTANGSANGGATFAFTNPNKPASIVLAANPAQGVTNNQGPVTLTATLTPVDVINGAIPNNTPVTFSILSGTGTLSSATANTSNGVASVTLNSTVAGTVSVRATAGTAPVVNSNTVNVPFINQPTLVTIKLATSGNLGGALIGGIQAIVTANPSSGLTIQNSDVTLSGVSAGSLLAPNTSNVASVQLALINTTGFSAGEFATLVYHVAPGTFPAAGNFNAATVSVIDTNSAAIPGVTVVIQGVTIQ